MPFQSEKQRRYLWANEPEIARDWTDTYGSGIAKALGGRIGFFRGAQADTASGQSMSPGTSASGGSRGGGRPPGGGDRAMTYTAPINRHTGPTTQEALITGQKKKDLRDLLARQQAEKDYNPMGQIKPGPRIGPQQGGLKNWAANYAGANVGAGLGSMLLGGIPGLVLGTLFGNRTSRNLMNPRYKGSTLKDRLRNIFAFSNDYIPDQRIEPRGIESIDISKLINDPSDIGYEKRMMKKRKEEELRLALESQGITMEDLMGRVG